MNHFLFILGFISLTAVTNFSQADSSVDLNNKNISSKYENSMNTSDAQKVWPAKYSVELKKYKIIFVPGFLSNVIIGLGSHSLARFAKLGEYYDEQMKWLSSIGVESERVEYFYEGTPGENAPYVLSAVMRSSKPVILVAHSKGGLDAIQALMAMDDTVLKKIRGFLAIQVPFYGSPVADSFTEIKTKQYFAKWTLPKLNISFAALESLKTRSDATDNLEAEALFLNSLGKKIPFISFASYKSKKIDFTNPWQLTTGQDTIMFYSRTIMERDNGLKNDGLVPVKSAILPGSNYIVAENVDHAVPVMYCQILRFDRIKFLKTTLRLLLDQKNKL